MEVIDKHICKTCNKEYSSYSSLWNHTKNIHKNNTIKKCHNVVINSHNIDINSHNTDINTLKCKFCNKNFQNRSNRYRHEQRCKIIFEEKEKQNNEIKLAEINSNEKIKLAEIELEKYNLDKKREVELAKINLELKKVEIKKENSIIKRKTNSNPTIKNINKLLQNKINMNNSNLNSNNTTNIQNNTVHNHFKIEGFGKENILNVITDKEKKLILNQGCESIEKLIEIVYIGKYDKFKNILITNKRDNDIYTYDDKSDLYIINDKNSVLNKLVANRLDNIEEIYNEFDENNKLTENNKKIMSRFFIKFTDEDKKYIDENANNKEYKNYIEYKVNKINNLLFNNQNKIIKDITTAIEKDNNTKEENSK
jgi:hypothetical protein